MSSSQKFLTWINQIVIFLAIYFRVNKVKLILFNFDIDRLTDIK